MAKSIHQRFIRTVPICAAALALSVAACTPGSNQTSTTGTSSGAAGRTAQGFAQFPDIAVPGGAKMDVERSLVLGARDDWIGRLSMDTSGNSSQTYDFFIREMPKFGWEEITTVRSEVSVLTYSRSGRVATIQIRNRTLGGASVDITVSPRGKPLPAATPQMPAAPADSVQTTPR